MIYASTFLSHSTKDKPLVEAVASELGRRGILVWLDKNELCVGASLDEALTEAIQRQATVTVFLSQASVKSDWVEHELKIALQKEQELKPSGRILPVFLDDPEILVRAHDLLRERWLKNGKLVERLGIVATGGDDLKAQASVIASQLATSIYDLLGIRRASEVAIYFDQRGEGTPRGEPEDVPEAFQSLDVPALVFRPAAGLREKETMVVGEAWEETRRTIKVVLAEALGNARGAKKIHLAGQSQLGFPFLIGHHFDRSTNADLHCYNRPRPNHDNRPFTNAGQPRESPLANGNADCETAHPDIPPLPANTTFETVSLLLCKYGEQPLDRKYLNDALAYLKANANVPPPIWVRHDSILTSSEHVMSYIADVVALLGKLRTNHGVKNIVLYTTLPFHALPLLAANLLFVVDSVVLMEYRRDLESQRPLAQDMYSPLSFQ